jgi:limonene-1,2-epoxide hydrolase
VTEQGPAQAAETYFAAWRANDFDRLQSVLADEVEFSGPLAQIKGAAECRRGIERMSEITTEIAIQKMFIDGADVLTWFDLHTTLAPPTPVANWSHIEDGKMTSIRVTFDPRGIAPPT